MTEILDGVPLCIPSAHAESHESGGDDELDLSGLPGAGGVFEEDANDNIWGGTDAGTELSAGADNFFAGAGAGKFGDGSWNIKIGNFAGAGAAGQNNTGNVFIGDASGYYASTGSYNVGVGHRTVYGNQTGGYNVAIGRNAGEGASFNSWSYSTCVGYAAGWKSTADNNVYIGAKAGYYNVSGADNVVIGFEAGYGVTNFNHSNNVFIGYQAALSVTTGSSNVFIGYQTGYSIETGGNNIAMGTYAGYSLVGGQSNIVLGGYAHYYNESGTSNVVIGYQAGQGVAANNYTGNVFIGRQAGHGITTGGYNVFMGYNAGQETESSSYCVFLGHQAGIKNTSGAGNIYIGANAGSENVTGSDNVCIGTSAGKGVAANNHSSNVFIGHEAGLDITTGNENVFMGYQAGHNTTTGLGNVTIGFRAGQFNVACFRNVTIGYEAGQNGATYYGTVLIGYGTGKNLTTNSESNTFVGEGAGFRNVTGINNVFIGHHAGYGVAAQSNSHNVFIGKSAGYEITTGSNNTFIGFEAGMENTTGYKNVAVGQEAGQFNRTGGENVLLGYRAGYGETTLSFSRNTYLGYQVALGTQTGSDNVGIGRNAFYFNETGGDNVVIGANAAFGVSGNSYSNNLIIGSDAAFSITTGGNNVLLGTGAGYSITTGAGNVFIGYQAGYNEAGSNKLYVENSNSADPLIYGEFDNDLIKINGDLEVTGSFPALTNLFTNAGFGVWSNSTLEDIGAQVTVTDVTSGVCLTGDTQDLAVGKLFRFDSGDFDTEVYAITAITTDVSFTIHDTSKTDSGTPGTGSEVTPACLAADSLGPDTWSKDSTLDIYREHSGSNTKGGEFYSLKMAPTAQWDNVFWPVNWDSEIHYKKFSGRTVAVGMWMLSSTASDIAIRINDGIGSTNSAQHTGGGDWEWIEISRDVSASNSQFTVQIIHNNASPGDAYISQPMLAFGRSIGEGNYVPRPEEIIQCESAVGATNISNVTISANTTYNVEAESDGKIPKGTHGIFIEAKGAATAINRNLIAQSGDGINQVRLVTQVANQTFPMGGLVHLNSDGEFILAKDAGDFANVWLFVYSIKLR